MSKQLSVMGVAFGIILCITLMPAHGVMSAAESLTATHTLTAIPTSSDTPTKTSTPIDTLTTPKASTPTPTNSPPETSTPMEDTQPLLPGPEDWPMYQHDPAHTSRTSETVFNDGPLYLQWAYSFGERVEIEAQPVLVDGVIFQGVMNGEMHAIDANTGEVRWIKRPGGPIPHSAAVDGEHVYFGSLDGNVYALSADNGSQAWSFKTNGPVVSAPAVVDGRLYIGSNDGNLYAIDAETGTELWHFTTGGPVVSSPAVVNGRVYFGSEDMTARCVDASTGNLIWATSLYGAGMHNTHPVVSDLGDVVIFMTVKAGASSYEPIEGCPFADFYADPIDTWNTYYQNHPKHRFLYYLDADTGTELWDPSASPPRYVPLPIPYWGLIQPILAPDGTAWFPAVAGTICRPQDLDHDYRLFKINLVNGVTTQVAGGPLSEFQLRDPGDEVGRHTFSGEDYYYTISEDLGVFRPGDSSIRALFSNGDPSSYNFGTHMHPLSPLPSRHLWRYGGAIAMGGVPGASSPVVSNGMIYFNSYSWLYAVGPTDHGLDPATSFPARDARLYELTYPRSNVPTLAEIQSEVEQRVDDILALGPDSPPITARWEQAGRAMLYNEFSFELYGFEADLVRVLSEALPHLSASQQSSLKGYLSTYVANTLLNPDHYIYERNCIHFGEDGVFVGEDNCVVNGEIISRWWTHNENLVGLRLYALWSYANATGDWDSIVANWSFIMQKFQVFLNAYDPDLGFCNFPEWRSGRLNIGAQIGAAQAVRDMAARLGYFNDMQQADTLLSNLLDGRVALDNFIPHLYDIGEREPAPIRLNPDGTIVYEDIMSLDSPYNVEMIPYYAPLRDRDTDPSQVNWWDGDTYRADAGIGFMYYPALSGFFPLSSEMINRLRSDLYDRTLYYVKSYEVNNPWWWMTDLAHSTTGGGEHLYHSPTLSWTLFQVKAWVLQEDWDTLVRQLPEPTSFNVQYDLYRLQNLVTLLELNNPTPEPTFVDVPFDYWAHDYIEMIYQEGYVAGCNLYPHMYCPDHTMNRAESAVFVERGVHGGGYIPADPVTQVFADVPLDQWYAKWANGLWEDGYTAGCDTDPLIYCPLQGHTRTEGSVFFLRMMNGVDYVPPAPVGIFADLAIDWWGTKWAEAAYNEGIIDPCQVEPEMLFCPDNELTRAYAAYMMVKAKGLTLP